MRHISQLRRIGPNAVRTVPSICVLETLASLATRRELVEAAVASVVRDIRERRVDRFSRGSPPILCCDEFCSTLDELSTVRSRLYKLRRASPSARR